MRSLLNNIYVPLTIRLGRLFKPKRVSPPLNISAAKIHKKLHASLEGQALPELDPSSPYPALGILGKFISKFIDLRKIPQVDFRDEKNIHELRAVFYGTEAALNKTVNESMIANLKKRSKVEHKMYPVQFIDPVNLAKSELRIDHFIPIEPTNKKPVLIMHGIYSGPRDMVQAIRNLTKQGFPVMIFSYPGFASTNRSHNTKSIMAGVLSAFRAIKEQGFNEVDLLAHSLGAAIATKSLSMIDRGDDLYPKFHNLVFVAPFDSSRSNLNKIVDRLIATYVELKEKHKPALLKIVKAMFGNDWHTQANLKRASHNQMLGLKKVTVFSGAKDAIADAEAANLITKNLNPNTATEHLHFNDRGHFTMYEGEHFPYDEIGRALVIGS